MLAGGEGLAIFLAVLAHLFLGVVGQAVDVVVGIEAENFGDVDARRAGLAVGAAGAVETR